MFVFITSKGNFIISVWTVFGVGVRRCGVGGLEVLSQSTDPGSKSKDGGGQAAGGLAQDLPKHTSYLLDSINLGHR